MKPIKEILDNYYGRARIGILKTKTEKNIKTLHFIVKTSKYRI